jgi:hypothetical protein
MSSHPVAVRLPANAPRPVFLCFLVLPAVFCSGRVESASSEAPTSTCTTTLTISNCCGARHHCRNPPLSSIVVMNKQHAEPALSFSSSVSWASEKGLWCLARLGLAVSIVSLSKAHIKVPSVPVSRCRLCNAHQAPPQHGVNGRKSKFSKTTTAAIDAPTAENTRRSTAVPSGLPSCDLEEA